MTYVGSVIACWLLWVSYTTTVHCVCTFFAGMCSLVAVLITSLMVSQVWRTLPLNWTVSVKASSACDQFSQSHFSNHGFVIVWFRLTFLGNVTITGTCLLKGALLNSSVSSSVVRDMLLELLILPWRVFRSITLFPFLERKVGCPSSSFATNWLRLSWGVCPCELYFESPQDKCRVLQSPRR